MTTHNSSPFFINTMKRIIFLRTTLCSVAIMLWLYFGLTTTALSQISPKQAQDESALSNPLLSSRFSVEGSLGFIFSSGQNIRGLNWINKLILKQYADVEIGMRFPLSTNAVWYTGLQGAIYDDGSTLTTFPSGWQSVTSLGKIAAHGGIEYALGGGLRMRSTLGAGLLWGDVLTRITVPGLENETRDDVQSFTMSIRQNIMYDINSVLSTGIKFEQTFSRYDNFFNAGLVLGIRF
jgi:hypothetical protein